MHGIFGIVLISAGLLLTFAGKIPWLGRLPGDIFYKSDHVTVYFPLATSLVYFGAKVTPEELADQVYLPERKGSLQVEMMASARRNGMAISWAGPSTGTFPSARQQSAR